MATAKKAAAKKATVKKVSTARKGRPRKAAAATPAAGEAAVIEAKGTTAPVADLGAGADAPDVSDKEKLSQDEARLAVVFADRLQQLFIRRPHVIRAGRGQINDFKDRFQIHYSTAHRLLTGKGLPTVALLMRIAQEFDCNAMWLMGQGDPDVDEHLDTDSVRIRMFHPRSEEQVAPITVPVQALPKGLDVSRMVAHDPSDGFLSSELLMVLVTAEAKSGELHVVFHPDNSSTTLEYIDIIPGNKLVMRGSASGYTTHHKVADLDYGKTEGMKRLTVVGPVIGSLKWKTARGA